MNVDFSFCLILNRELIFSRTEPIFSKKHKLLPVQLTWLLLVYGKILYFARHPLFVVYVECYPLQYNLDNLPKDYFICLTNFLLLTDGKPTCLC